MTEGKEIFDKYLKDLAIIRAFERMNNCNKIFTFQYWS